MVSCWAWWLAPVAPDLRKLKLEDGSWAAESFPDESGLQSKVLLPICLLHRLFIKLSHHKSVCWLVLWLGCDDPLFWRFCPQCRSVESWGSWKVIIRTFIMCDGLVYWEVLGMERIGPVGGSRYVCWALERSVSFVVVHFFLCLMPPCSRVAFALFCQFVHSSSAMTYCPPTHTISPETVDVVNHGLKWLKPWVKENFAVDGSFCSAWSHSHSFPKKHTETYINYKNV